ncbi:hypothetical protein K8352_12970 [Flavobacteriaceae bacterium F89]|uniref:Uncharacterized protein n=1 Tax=Cerina litoralis TaxID=2874477 RepID=A0AAE3EXN0_9FLAO|nr:hypothetical protein [Cerina litoralis]MCG2461666.1 hypothetical protein [Cerina litoralis]
MKRITASILLFLMVVSYITNTGSEAGIAKIENADLIFDVSGNLQAKFSATLPDTRLTLSDFQSSKTLVIDGITIDYFSFNSIGQKALEGNLSTKEWILNRTYNKDGLHIKKKTTLATCDMFPDQVSTRVTYSNNSEHEIYVGRWSHKGYTKLSHFDSPSVWAFQGSSPPQRDDRIYPLVPGYYQNNIMDMKVTYYERGIPVTSVWMPDINIAVGHFLAKVYKRVNLPTEIPANAKDVKVILSKDIPDRFLFKSKDRIQTKETFISDSIGDYFVSSFGMGAVLDTRFTWPIHNPNSKEDLILTLEKEKYGKNGSPVLMKKCCLSENV